MNTGDRSSINILIENVENTYNTILYGIKKIGVTSG